MIEQRSIDFKINCIISRGKNIIYYRKIDNRPRCQYIHVVRTFRKDIKELILLISDYDNPKYLNIKELLIKIIQIIPPKIKSEDCERVIMKLSEILMTQEEFNNIPTLPISINQIFDE